MEDLGWKLEYRLGIPAMDLQHERIFDRLTAMAGGSAGQDRLLAESALVRLLTLLQQHAALEESMMRSFGCPGLERHIAEHRQFHGDVHALAQKSLRTKEPVSLDVIKVLHQRQREHLMTSDRRYVKYLLGPPHQGGGGETGGNPANNRAGAGIGWKSLRRGQTGHCEPHAESL